MDIPEGKIEESENQLVRASLGLSPGNTWADLLKSKRVLIVSEAGSGKTHECKEQSDQLWSTGEAAFRLELATLATTELRTMLEIEQEARFDRWLSSQSEIATFFLDSYDELKLSLGSFDLALKRLARAITGRLDRARIVITTRPIPFDEALVRRLLPVPEAVVRVEPTEENFARIALHGSLKDQADDQTGKKHPDWATVALLPLSDEQIVEFARLQGVENPDDMFADLKRRNALEFARRPQDLIELSADWRDHKRIRTHREQVAGNIRIKLKPREDRAEPAELSVEKAMDGARRLALAMMMTRRLTIRHSAASDHGGSEAAFDPGLVLPQWTEGEIKALLERAMFGFASYGRVRFHHRSVLEFLAAERIRELRSKRMTARALKRLIFTETRGKIIVRHSKRAIAGWLALSEHTIFETLRANEPDVLLNEGDPESLTVTQRVQALRAYVKRHGKGGWRGRKVPGIQIHRFASAELSGEITRLWNEGIENPEIRELILELIELGQISECSDIAFACASNPEAEVGERLAGLDALAALGDTRLPAFVETIATGSPDWSERLSKIAIMRLFPKHMAIAHLFQILPRLLHWERNVGDLQWFLPTTISQYNWNPGELEEIRDGFAKLISAKLRWQEQWPHYASDNGRLAALLAVTCIRGLEETISTGWLRASALAILLAHNDYPERKDFSQLLDTINGLTAGYSREFFWATDSLVQSLHAITDPWKRYASTTLQWKIRLRTDRDADWIKVDLADSRRSEADRSMLLETAMRLRPDDDTWLAYLEGLREQVTDLPEFGQRIDERIKHLSTKSQLEEWEIEQAKWKEDAAKKEERDLQSWKDFWSRISEDPEGAFSKEREANTIWNLWRAMTKAGSRGRDSGWNRQFIEGFLGREMADRLRLALMGQWRSGRPTFASERPEEEKGTYLLSWELGLAGIYAETEDPEWATRLKGDEACLAARYATIELNSLPAWIEALVKAHPSEVEETLGNELIAELNDTNRDLFHSMLLQNIGHSAETVKALFVPRLIAWLDEKSGQLANGQPTSGEIRQMTQVTGFLSENGGAEIESHMGGVAEKYLHANPSGSLGGVWLPILLRFDPENGIDVLDRSIRSIPPSAKSEAVILLGGLFGDRDRGISPGSAQFTPAILLRLMRILYKHVRPEDDVHHHGAYSPDDRDNAEQARNNIVNTILTSKGEEGWAAKMEMSRDPLCAHFKDRILALAEESWAEEVDGIAYNNEQAIALDQSGEAPPATNEAMFRLLVDRLSEIEDQLLGDTSLRELWATITDEKVMRRAIARELSLLRSGLYTVDQEAVTADEKETDIRLRSTVSSHEATIELKQADDRTARDLRNTIEKQLVNKYMAAELNRSGCLLLTIARDRKWRHPETKAWMNTSALLKFLRDEASEVAKKFGGTLQIHIHLLDLRPRLGTEAQIEI